MICVTACLENTRRGRRIIDWCNRPHAGQAPESVAVHVYNPVLLESERARQQEREVLPTAPPHYTIAVMIAPPPNLAKPMNPYGVKVES